VQNEKAKLVALSGFPVEMTEGDLTETVGAMIQMAWKHARGELTGIEDRSRALL
jgi:hypothetical protein